MHRIDLGGGGAPCPVLAGNPLTCCSEIMTCENCQGNSQMVIIEAKTFQT